MHEHIFRALTFDDVLLLPQYSTVLPRQTRLESRLAKTMRLGLPFLSAAMDTVTEARMAIAMARAGGLGVLHKNMSVEAQATLVREVKGASSFSKDILEKNTDTKVDADGSLRVAAALGVGADFKERLRALVTERVDLLVIDTAHGHSQSVLEAVALVRQAHPKQAVAAGNVATGEGALALSDAGADVIKVGVGPGSICTTRIVAGVGVPQLSAILACAKALQGRNVTLVADGGIRTSGDVVKALAAGAHAVMLGSLFAGCDEAPGETSINAAGQKVKVYRGMGSLEAMAHGSADRYFQENLDKERAPKKLVAEGVSGHVLAKGPASEILAQLAGGLRQGMGYLGASTLEELRASAQWIGVTPAGRAESLPHDIML